MWANLWAVAAAGPAVLGVKEGVVFVVISGGYISKHPVLYRVLESDMASVEGCTHTQTVALLTILSAHPPDTAFQCKRMKASHRSSPHGWSDLPW